MSLVKFIMILLLGIFSVSYISANDIGIKPEIKIISKNIISFKYNPDPVFYNTKTGPKTTGSMASVKIGLLVSGIVTLCLGVAGIAVGAPMFYYASIGLGYIDYHPGIVEVRPYANNMIWLWLGFGFGIGLLSAGILLFITGCVTLFTYIFFDRPGHASNFYMKPEYVKNVCNYSLGFSYKI